jgi:transcription-repair coupling factor (superfamily II helicase)
MIDRPRKVSSVITSTARKESVGTLMAPENEEFREEIYEAALHPLSVEGQLILLTERVKNLARENRALKNDVRQLQVAYQRGFGAFLVFPFLGGVLGFIATYWSSIFKSITK